MTDCCLCVWCRPAPHKRLISSLYPAKAKGNEPTLLPVSASKLVQYALVRPLYLGAIARDLSTRARKDWSRGRYGFARIALSALEQLVEACGASGNSHSYMDPSALAAFDAIVIDVINSAMCHSHPDIRAAGISLCAKFIAGQDILVDQARLAAFLSPLLSVIAGINGDVVKVGDLEAIDALMQLIRKATPQALVDHTAYIAPIMLPQIHREMARIARRTAAPLPEGLVASSAPETHSSSAFLQAMDSCLRHIALSMNPAVSSGILAPFFAYLDDAAWQPRDFVSHILQLLDEPQAASSTFDDRVVAESTVMSPAALSKSTTYRVPMFLTLLRHLAQIDEYFSAIANAVIMSHGEQRSSFPAVTVGMPSNTVADAPLPSVPSVSSLQTRQSATLPAPRNATEWLSTFRTALSQGRLTDEVGGTIAAAVGHAGFEEIEKLFTSLRVALLRQSRDLLQRASGPLSSYSHDVMDVIVPILLEPDAAPCSPSAATPGDNALHAEALSYFNVYLQKTTTVQHVMRLASEVAEWYLDFYAECANLSLYASAEAAPADTVSVHKPLRKSDSASHDVSAAVAKMPSPSSIHTASSSRRLSRTLASAFAASAVSPSMSANSAEVASFVEQSIRAAASTKLRMHRLLWLTVDQASQIVRTTSASVSTKIQVPKFLVLSIESSLIEADTRLRTAGLLLLHALLGLSGKPGQRMPRDWENWLTSPVQPHLPDVVVCLPARAAGWCLSSPTTPEQLRFPARECLRILSALFYMLTAASEHIEKCGGGLVEGLLCTPQELSLISLVLADCLDCFGTEALIQILSFAGTLQASTKVKISAVFDAAATNTLAGHKSTISTHATTTLASITEEEEPSAQLFNWGKPWRSAHCISLAASFAVAFAVNDTGALGHLKDVLQARILAGKAEIDLWQVHDSGLIGPPTNPPAVEMAHNADEVPNEIIDFDLVSTNIQSSEAFNDFIAKHIATSDRGGSRTDFLSPVISSGFLHTSLGLQPPEDGQFEGINVIGSLLRAPLVLLPKFLVVRELHGVGDGLEKHVRTALEKPMEKQQEDDFVIDGTGTGEQADWTVATTAVKTLFVPTSTTAEPQSIDINAIKARLLQPQQEHTSALDFEKTSYGAGDDGGSKVLHDAAFHGTSLLQPWKSAAWLKVATDTATYWDVDNMQDGEPLHSVSFV